MGRPRTPTATHKVRGTFRPDRHGNDLVIPALEKLPPCPARLEGEAQRVWKTLGRKLIAQRILTSLDLDVLADLCVIEARLIEAEANVKKFGLVLVAETGGMYQNPYLAVANRCYEQLAGLRAQFGLSPVSRTKIRAAPLPEADETRGKLRFFNGGGEGA